MDTKAISALHQLYMQKVVRAYESDSTVYTLRRLRPAADLISFLIRDSFAFGNVPHINDVAHYCMQNRIRSNYFKDVVTIVTDTDINFICRRAYDVIEALKHQLITYQHRWFIKDLCETHYNTYNELTDKLNMMYTNESLEVSCKIMEYILFDAPSQDNMLEYFARNRLNADLFTSQQPFNTNFINYLFMNSYYLLQCLSKQELLLKHTPTIRYACNRFYNNMLNSLTRRLYELRQQFLIYPVQ